MRHHGNLESDRQRDEEANQAAYEAGKGALAGAAEWGIYSAILAGAGYVFSPVYRGLTVQFKVFLQMSGMTLGGMLQADRRVRELEIRNRRERKMRRDAEAWRAYEREFEEVGPARGGGGGGGAGAGGGGRGAGGVGVEAAARKRGDK